MAYGSRPYGSAPYGAGGSGSVAVGLTAGGGLVEIAGGPASVLAGTGVALSAGGGSIAVAGGSATVTAGTGVALTAGGGSVALSGGPATLSAGATLDAGGGAVDVIGGPATVTAGTGAVEIAGGGAVAITGGPAAVIAGTGVALQAGGGAVSITGGQPDVTAGENADLTAGGGRILLAAGLATLVIGQVLTAGGGSVAVAGGPATVVAGTGVVLEAGGTAVEVLGGPATVTAGAGVILTAGGAAVTIEGGAAVITIGATVQAGGGKIAVEGGPAAVTAGAGQVLAAGGGEVRIVGGPAAVEIGVILDAGGGSIAVSGGPATVIAAQPVALTAGGATIEVTGGPAVVSVEQSVTLSAGGTRITVTGGAAFVYAEAPYGPRTPAPGDLAALVADHSAMPIGIFEVHVYRTSLGASEWVRWSSAPLTTEPDDSLPNYEFADRLTDFSASSNLWASDDARGIILGESRANSATATLDNSDGALDDLFNPSAAGVREYHWRRRPARYRMGHESWGFDDYVVAWAGHVEEAQADGQTATLQLADILERLDSPVTETVYEGTAWIGESGSSVTIGTGSKSFVLPTKITNGDFTTNLTGWTAGTGWAQSGGAAVKTAGTASSLAQDNVATAADNLYRLRATLTRSAGSITVLVDGAPLEDATFSAAATIDLTFTAAGSATDIAFSADASFAGSLDAVTLRQEPEAEPGDMANIARSSDPEYLADYWMWGEVLSWTPSTGTLVVDVDTSLGSGTYTDWSIWLRAEEGGPDMAGRIVPDPMGIVRRHEPDYLGSVQGHLLYRGAVGVWAPSDAYDGGASIPIAGSFPPAPGEVYVDTDRGLAWVANDVTPNLPFTVDVISGSGTLYARRVWTQAGSYSFVVPSGVTSIRFKGWGGGGAGATSATGGAGAFVDTTIAVTPGESLLVVIGGGGRWPSPLLSGGTFSATGGASALGPGGVGGGATFLDLPASAWGGGGGGATGLRRGAARLVVVGAGGGAANSRNGGAGGLDGADGGPGGSQDGDGATESAPGTGGVGANPIWGDGDSRSLGEGGWGRGGGGGGKHGGGGGGTTEPNIGAGGGGSSEDSGGTTEDGSADTPGGASDADWDSVAGKGGQPQSDGADGRVVVTYEQSLAGVDPTAGNFMRAVLRDRRGYRLIEADQSTLVSVAADADTKTFTFGASLAPLGIQELDVFSLAGTAENAGANYTVLSATDTTITVKEAVVDMGADTAFRLTIGEVDGTALAAIDTVTDPLGYILREGSETGRQVADKIVGSLGWFVDVTQAGLVTFGPFGPPAEVADLVLDEDAEGSIFEITRMPAAPALWRVKAGAERCYRVHGKPEIATIASDAERKFVLSEWREAPPDLGTNTDVRAKDLAAEETFFSTLFAFRQSLTTRVPEWLSWFTPDRQAYQITVGPRAWAIRQGMTVSIRAPSIGITTAVNMVVIGRDVGLADPTANRLILWR